MTKPKEIKAPNGEKKAGKSARPKRTRKRSAADGAASGNDRETVDLFGYRRLREGPRRSPPARFADILPSVIARFGLNRKLSVEKFEGAWQTALDQWRKSSGAGGLVDPNDCRLSDYRSGTLRVDVRGGPLLQELSFGEADLLARLQTLLPDEKIKKIRFVLK